MKRFLIMILALLLIAGTFACGGSKTTPEQQPTDNTEATAATAAGDTPAPADAPAPTEEPEPEAAFAAGKYVLTAYQVGDAVIEGETLAASGMDRSTLTLNADRTGMLVLMDESYEIGWTDDGSVTFSGVPIYSMSQADNNVITFRMGDAIMTFLPEGAASAGTVVEATEAPAEPDVTEAPSEPDATEAPAVTKAPTEAPAQVGEAAFPGAPYGDSDGIVDRAKLAGFYRWMHDLPSDFLYAMTFDEISAAVGKPGQDKQNNDGKTQGAVWSDGDRSFVTVTFKDKGDGNYACCAISVSGIASDEYNAADISGFPKIASSTPAGTNPTETQTFETKIGFSGPKVNVTAEIPAKNWHPHAGSSSIYIYCAPNAERADRSSSYFKIECKESLDKINFYLDKFENLVEIEPRTIGGIEMPGRMYHYIGMDWVEYYGEIAEGVWVSINMSGVDLSEGTETEAILMSMTFALQ